MITERLALAAVEQLVPTAEIVSCAARRASRPPVSFAPRAKRLEFGLEKPRCTGMCSKHAWLSDQCQDFPGADLRAGKSTDLRKQDSLLP